MNNNIFIDLEESDTLLKVYQQKFPSKAIPKTFQFDKSIPVTENLDNLALYALNQSCTIPVLYSYNQIFLDIISRWIIDPAKFEKALGANNVITGSVILHKLSQLIQISSESISLIEYYVAKSDFFSLLSGNAEKLTSHELQKILLAFYRMVNFDTHRFKSFIKPDVLYEVISWNNDGSNEVSKYLAIQILSKYLEVSEVAKAKMISTHIGDNNDLIGPYEGDDKISYKALSFLEAKRLSNFTKLPEKESATIKSNRIISIEPSHLTNLVTSICGILVPHFIDSDPQTEDAEIKEDHFVPTDNSVVVLRKLACYIQNNKPVMLHGQAGSGKTFLINQLAKYMKYEDSIVKIHLGEQTDSKLLLGTYSSGEKPGTFQWRSGVLTTAVREGKWVLIEDIDKAPTEVLSVLLTLLEKRELSIPSRGEVIKAKNGFQMISTIRTSNDSGKATIPDIIGLRMWDLINVQTPSDSDFRNILNAKFPLLERLIVKFIHCYREIIKIYSASSFISLNKGSHPRVISFRDLIKFCARCNRMLMNHGVHSTEQLLESSIYDNIFAEAVDCFGSAITEYSALLPLIKSIGEVLEIPSSRINLFLNKHVPAFHNDDDSLSIGRATLHKSITDKALFSNKSAGYNSSFARTNHSLRLMEQIGVAIDMVEPVLLVGETGTGKTTVVQQVAKMMNKKLTVINVSQQTESGDLLGGYKPVNTKTVAVPIQEVFENLFMATFSKKKNEKFATILSKCFNKNQWKNVVKLWSEAIRMAKGILTKAETEDSGEDGAPKKKQKSKVHEKSVLLDKWVEFEAQVKDFEIHASSLENSFVFNFVEGSLVKAVRNGEWLLLDEINLASPDTLESIADLLSETLHQRSILLSERGDVDAIKAHPDFRIFGCMNPSTDVGKRDLPMSIRSRLTEIYVHSPDRDIQDLLSIIDKYIGRYAVGDEWVGNDIAELYLEAKKLSESNKIVDGANQKPHFSIRTLTRTLLYVCDIVSIYGLRRSLYEGFCMSFLTLLDIKSESILKPIIEKYTIGKLKNMKSVMSQRPPLPSGDLERYVQFKHYWLQRGPGEVIPQPHYIITPFVEKNMLNLVRATAGNRFPVLVQGPTSAGKTSMINYLANITGHKFVRINNHEHTDLQEYLGTYISDSTGKLMFKEGVLVDALRKGHWIVLDELNLAPTDVLEALNRLLDDNRELFIPETQEVVRPHPNFMLFATQNPPGLYGGRKMLSRAFRNRFLELHFDDIPQDELEIILKERCQIAPSYGKKIVEVYRQLSIQRQSSRLFEQKNSFATLRDLFRWALRDAVGYEELASNGYMLLAERVRKEDEKILVKETIEKVMKVKLDMDAYYDKLQNKELFNIPSSIVWTKAMRRLAVLVMSSLKYKEPLLLVGETGCGKTTVCQIVAKFLGKELIVVNAHQNTETGDLLGAQRPVRNRFETRSVLFNNLVEALHTLNIEIPLNEAKLEDLVKKYDANESNAALDPKLKAAIEEGKRNSTILFEWNDGPLVHAMKDGQFFLLDEISLADDSVLERLNSVLEPEKSLLLAEKGTDDAFIEASEGFEFLATMNPGGDYGKKELSPALRNRFTEIWVPSMEDFEDVRQIVHSKLADRAKHLCMALVDFSKWFGKRFGGGNVNSGVISLRDILAWVEFIGSCGPNMSPEEALLHGAALVFIDALGTNNTAYLAEDETRLHQQKLDCVEKLSELASVDLSSMYREVHEVSLQPDRLVSGPFSCLRVDVASSKDQFTLHAPTTATNAMRVLRAMQVHKPILLEGSPGVGKTSLVSAIANATGNSLIRINLSEQTDLVDLFGSDAPAEGGNTGEFVWRDAPFLRAMQKGEWVLLDEMNLASQSVLEGLNACLDHRGEAYIPELDKSFSCHPDFKVFAAQNPQYQGGGRKGLPKSFVNRFTVVYVDVLKADDLNLISEHIFPTIESSVRTKMIEFMSKLESEVVVKKSWGSSGGPWEFNLRDTLRWLGLFNTANIMDDLSPFDFFNMIVCQRFRTKEDRCSALKLYESVFGPSSGRDNFYNLTKEYLQVGGALIRRNDHVQYSNSSNLLPLQCNFPILESAIRCVNQNTPLILVGSTNSGKTELIRYLAHVVGAKIDEFAMNSEVDSMDILGGYEQVDLTRSISALTSDVHETITDLLVANLSTHNTEPIAVSQSLRLVNYIDSNIIDTENYEQFNEFFKAYLAYSTNSHIDALFERSEVLLKRVKEDRSVKFEWFDGLLVKAVEKGNWLILDNANLCSPSVLDRLNSLLETNGSLIINECSSEDGQPRTLKPHPNFRLFLTVDPKYGELSRAMRNRGVEVYMETLAERATEFDCEMLSIPPPESRLKDNIVAQMETLKVTQNFVKPSIAFTPSNLSQLRVFSLVNDFYERADDASEGKSAIIGIIPFSEIEYLGLIHQTISASSEFADDFKGFFTELMNELAFLRENGAFDQIYGLYKDVTEKASSTLGLNEGFAKSQFIHLLYNSYLQAALQKSAPFVNTSEPTLLLDAAGKMLEATSLMSVLEERAISAKVGDLSYIERSAAFQLGRNIKKPPRLGIYDLVKNINDYINATFRESLSHTGFETSTLYSALSDLQVTWKCLLEASAEQNEARMRTYQTLVRSWTEQNQDNEYVNLFLNKLKDTVDAFGTDLELTTGHSMSKLWEYFRQEYPSSEVSWENTKSIMELADRFDEVASEQFNETADLVTNLRSLIIDLYEDVLTNKVSSEEYETLAHKLQEGIFKLTEVSQTFLQKRKNDFQYEFTLLSNFVEASSKSESAGSELLLLSNYSKKSTLSLLKGTRGNHIMPYPSILDAFFTMSNGEHTSYVSELFTNEILMSTMAKSVTFENRPGKFLQQNIDDITFLGKKLLENSESLLANQKMQSLKLLVEWFNHFVQAHEALFEAEVLTRIVNLTSTKSLNVSDLSAIIECLNSSKDQSFSRIANEYMVPALYTAQNSDSLEHLGKAWVLFSCGAIQLYVPSSAYDPAIKEYVVYRKFEEQQKSCQDLATSWSLVRKIVSGKELHIETLLPEVSDQETPNKPRVFRREEDKDDLFSEWKAFMDSTVDIEPVTRLLQAAEELSSNSSKMIEMFQNNSSQFLARLDSNYLIYSDLNDILRGYVYGLKLGFDLLSLSKRDETADFGLNKGFPVDAISVANSRKANDFFDIAINLTKKIGVDSSVPEHVMLYFVQVTFAHNAFNREKATDPILHTALQSLYYRWSLRRMKQEEEAAQQGSLYKYSDPDADIEGDFRTLFPDFEDVLDVEVESFKKIESFDNVYSKLGKLYIDYFTSGLNVDLQTLVKDGSKLTEALAEFESDLSSDVNSPSYLASVITSLARSLEAISSQDQELDFYRGSSLKEFRRAITIISSAHSSVTKLLSQWPEHATLQNIATASEEFLNFPANSPISKLIQKVEQIYTYISEWEKYASSQVSLKPVFDELTLLIVSWRKLELSTWQSLFKYEDAVMESNVGKWWFHLFETIIIPCFDEDQTDSDDSVKLLSALNVFMSQATYGEFSSRMNLIKAFKNHVAVISPNGMTFAALSNFIGFYEQFSSVIASNIETTKKKLEKDVSEVILLASWKDVNIDALKQSARRSHNNLYKIVRKYRALLATTISPIIEQGINSDVLTAISLRNVPAVNASVNDSSKSGYICQEISTWSQRPSRLQNMTTIDKNLSVYVSRISGEALPTLEAFTQDIVQEMERLRKETPTVLNDKTKKLVATLKTQKRKLLSDTLREIRRSGLKIHHRQDIQSVSATVNLILSNSTPFDDSLLENSDGYYFRILDLLPRLRASVANVAEDVPQNDAEKGLAAAENLVFSLITTRAPLLELSRSVDRIKSYYDTFEQISSSEQDSVFLARTTVVDSVHWNLKMIKNALYWLPKIADFSIAVLDASSSLGCKGSATIFYDVKARASELVCKIESLNLHCISNESLRLIDEFRSFYDDIKFVLNDMNNTVGGMSFVASLMLTWIRESNYEPFINSSTSITDIKTVENIEAAFRDLSNAVLISVQKVIEAQSDPITEEHDDWFVLSQQRLFKYVKSCYHKRVLQKMELTLKLMGNVEYDSNAYKLVAALTSFTLPLIHHYAKLLTTIFTKARDNYVSTSKSAFTLSTVLYNLATKGFCAPSPPNEEKENDNLQDGTGLGDGEGAENNSKDIEQDDDLTEDAQQPNEENKDRDDNEDENDDAVDMEGDMAGDIEETSDQEKEDDEQDGDDDEELDEEIDDIDDLDPNAVDEKMWDEEAKEDNKEKDSDKMPENSTNDDDNMEANEDEEMKGDDENKQKDENNEDDDNQEAEENDGASDDESKDVGEQEDEVKNDENEQLEDHVPETETLDLPEDMNLDGDEDKEDQEEDVEDEEFDDKMDTDDIKNEEDDKKDDQQEQDGDEKDADIDQEGADEDQEEPEQDDDEEEGDNDAADNDTGVNEDEGIDSEEEAIDGDDEAMQKEEDGGEDEKEGQENAEGVDGADDNNGADDDVDKDSAVQTEAGDKGEGADTQDNQENDDIGATGGASMDNQQEKNDEDSTTQDTARDLAKESLKELGDSLKEFHRRHQEIKEAVQEEKDEKVENSANERPDEFQHVEGENTSHDTQALGAADKEQIQSIDEDKAIDDDEPMEDQEREVKEESKEDDQDQMDVDDDAEEVGPNEADPDNDFEGKTKGGFIGERKKSDDDEELIIKSEFDEETFNGDLHDQMMVDSDINTDLDEPPRPIEEARELWKHSELATQELASGLCEQLRLILEPTLATKLRGDYKTGKRLNMKRIIPYIASEFRKDKIWLRRTKPSKRQYQVMIAVDDSKSMSESKSTELAFHSIALVSKALTQLESGGLSIVRFGEDVKLVHPFDKPFNNQESGTKIFQWFDFQQTRTDIKMLCNKSLKIFEDARSMSSADLWQLQIIISDGVCEDHETIQSLVRRAREEKIMLVFVVIDGINSSESIMDMSQVKYITDPVTGAMNLKVDKYLDSFPFEFYVVVKNITELPEMLSLILRQYFSEVSNL